MNGRKCVKEGSSLASAVVGQLCSRVRIFPLSLHCILFQSFTHFYKCCILTLSHFWGRDSSNWDFISNAEQGHCFQLQIKKCVSHATALWKGCKDKSLQFCQEVNWQGHNMQTLCLFILSGCNNTKRKHSKITNFKHYKLILFALRDLDE